MKRILSLAAAGALAAVAVVSTAPASHATVHEIVGQWCSGQDELEPRGISDPTKRNFAQPLNANGFIDGLVPHADGWLVNFDFDHPASKVVGTGVFIPIGVGPEGKPLYLQLIETDPDFPAFTHCPRLASP